MSVSSDPDRSFMRAVVRASTAWRATVMSTGPTIEPGVAGRFSGIAITPGPWSVRRGPLSVGDGLAHYDSGPPTWDNPKPDPGPSSVTAPPPSAGSRGGQGWARSGNGPRITN